MDIRPTVLASAGDGTFSAMTFNGRLYVLLVGGTQPAALIAHVKAAQQPNGAWNFAGTPTGTAVDPDTTGLALQALAVRDVPSTDPAVRRGLAALARSQQPDGSWLSFGVDDPNSTALAVLGIRATGGDPNTPCWREALDDAWAGVPYADPADWLRGEQADDGHIAAPADEFGVTTFATSQAVQAILGLNPLFDARLARTRVRGRRRRGALRPRGLRRPARPAGRRRRHRLPGRGACAPARRGSVIRSLTGRRSTGARWSTASTGPTSAGRRSRRPGDLEPVGDGAPRQGAGALLASGEYFRKAGGTNGGFVDALYRDVLGRSADERGSGGVRRQLAFGRSRSAVAQTLLDEPWRPGRPRRPAVRAAAAAGARRRRPRVLARPARARGRRSRR